jgi:transcriptional regulator with XRE-family HTH domain
MAKEAITLKALRESLGLNQEDLAKRLGIDQGAVSRMENRTDLKVSTIKRYIKACGGELTLRLKINDKVYNVQGNNVREVKE